MINLLRLTTGESLIGEIQEHDDGSVTIDKPAMIQLQMVEPGRLGVGMIPYQPWCLTGKITFWKSALLGPCSDVDEHTANSYNKQFNPSGIITPESSGLILG
jgi:hypothetical protein